MQTTTTQRPRARNCKEIIDGKLQVQWEIQKDSVIVELYGRIMEEQYMAFGISGANGRSQVTLIAIQKFLGQKDATYILFFIFIDGEWRCSSCFL